MALRPDRKFTDGTDISFFMNETGEKGEILVFNTSGSGAAMDDANAVVTTPGADPSGEKIAGMLLNDVVDKDLTRTHINEQKDEVQLGGKVTLGRQGVAVTNLIASGDTPTAGDPAYYVGGAVTHPVTLVGRLTTSIPDDFGVAAVDGLSTSRAENYRVGTFLSVKDADGFAKVQINIL